jgi:hypothetical protein
VWIHDYHLMVLPKMLRLQKPRCTIGWFLHIPFPTSEIYKVRVRGSPQHYVYTCYVVHVFASALSTHILFRCVPGYDLTVFPWCLVPVSEDESYIHFHTRAYAEYLLTSYLPLLPRYTPPNQTHINSHKRT